MSLGAGNHNWQYLSPPKRIHSVDLLRGIAALWVAGFHLSVNGTRVDIPFIREFLAQGSIGVPIFFVISGLVIPLSLHQARFRLANLGTFVLKRIVRLEPPYLASALIIVVVWILYKKAPDGSANLMPLNLALHLGYFIDWGRYFGLELKWLQPVYWTLGYELQFYLFIALALPLATSRSVLSRNLLTLAFLLPRVMLWSLDVSAPILFGMAEFFMLGIVLFQRQAGITGRGEFATLSIVCLAISYTSYPVFPMYGLLICGLVLSIEIDTALTRFLGSISYSLYLVHDTIGMWTYSILATKFVLPSTISFSLAMLGSICAATVLFLAVERPALSLSRRLAYKRCLAPNSRSPAPYCQPAE